MMPSSRAPSIASQRISRPMSMSTAFSAWRNEKRGQDSDEPDQHGVGTSEQDQRRPYIGGRRGTAAASHDGVTDPDPGRRAGPGPPRAQRTPHSGSRIPAV